MKEKEMTVIGTITRDRIHFHDNTTIETFGGSPWFAVEIVNKLSAPINIVTNVGKDFPLNIIPDDMQKSSKIDTSDETTTTLDIFPDEENVPAIVRNFTGDIKNIDFLKGKIVIVSSLFQEVSLKLIQKLRDKFQTIILDIQGFTRPPFENNINLSDNKKTEPKNLQEICKSIDILKCNDNELDAILREESFQEKIDKLHRFGLKSIIITKGKDGCLVSTNFVLTEFKAKTVRTANTVGAGDKFLILVSAFLLKNNTLEKSIELAQRKLEEIMEENI